MLRLSRSARTERSRRSIGTGRSNQKRRSLNATKTVLLGAGERWMRRRRGAPACLTTVAFWPMVVVVAVVAQRPAGAGEALLLQQRGVCSSSFLMFTTRSGQTPEDASALAAADLRCQFFDGRHRCFFFRRRAWRRWCGHGAGPTPEVPSAGADAGTRQAAGPAAGGSRESAVLHCCRCSLRSLLRNGEVEAAGVAT